MPEEDVFNDEVEVAADIPENVVIKEYLSDIAIGDVETLDYGEDAYVTNSGTADHPVLNFGLPKGASGTIWGQLDGTLSDQADLQAALDAKDTAIATKANANNAALTGTPTAPTATSDTNSTQIATTAFVQNAITILETSLKTYVLQKVNKMLGRMNFSSAQTARITKQNSFTVPSDGYVFVTARNYWSQGGQQYLGRLYINGALVCGYAGNTITSSGYNIFDSAPGNMYPVSAGDVCTSGSEGQTFVDITFVPQKVEA